MLKMEISTISDSGHNRFNSVFEDTIYIVACVTGCIMLVIEFKKIRGIALWNVDPQQRFPDMFVASVGENVFLEKRAAL